MEHGQRHRPGHDVTIDRHKALGGKCRDAFGFLRERWRSDVLHNASTQLTISSKSSTSAAAIFSSGPARKQVPVRRCLSAVDDRRVLANKEETLMPLDRRDAGVQCSIIKWDPVNRRVDMATNTTTGTPLPFEFQQPVSAGKLDTDNEYRYYEYSAPFSAEEISLVATDGSGSTLGGSCQDDDGDHFFGRTSDEERAFLRWYVSASSSFVRDAPSSPQASSRSVSGLGCVKLNSPGCVPARIERLRNEFHSCHGTTASNARSSSCHSEPEVIQCCSGTAVNALAESRADASAWRRQFRRRKAITLSDIDLNQKLMGSSKGQRNPLMSSASTESVTLGVPRGERSCSQRSAITQQRFVT